MKLRCIYLNIWCALSFVCCSTVLHASEYDALVELGVDAVITVPVEGIVQTVEVVQGQQVKQGDVLLRLNPHTYQLRLKKAKAVLAAAEPVYRDALREKNDAKSLYEQTVLSEVELQAAMIAYDQADAKREQAEAELGLARWALGWTTVKAPFDAFITEVDVLPGQMIAGDNRSAILMRLAAAGKRVAIARLSRDDVVGIDIGSNARVKIGDKEYTATVSRIEMGADKPDIFLLTATFGTTGDSIQSGTTASIELR